MPFLMLELLPGCSARLVMFLQMHVSAHVIVSVKFIVKIFSSIVSECSYTFPLSKEPVLYLRKDSLSVFSTL